MSDVKLTDLEREYLECETPMLSAGKAAARVSMGVFASILQSAFMPGNSYGKADRGLMRTVREIRYTKFKKAVLRKRDGKPDKNDAKILTKLNKTDFILADDAYSNDEYTKKLYEEYMMKNGKEE